MGSHSVGRTDLDPSSPEWQKYYAEASRRRRARRKLDGGDKQKTLHEDRRRRRMFETFFMLGSIAFIGVLVAIFHRVLTH